MPTLLEGRRTIATQDLFEARYLLTRVEAVLARAADTWMFVVSHTIQRELVEAAADLEQAIEILSEVAIALSDDIVPRARGWGLVAWSGPHIRQGWREDRDQLLLLQGRLEQYLYERGITEDQPAQLGEAEARRQRVSNRRGRPASVTAAG